jgi:hypothetical protein
VGRYFLVRTVVIRLMRSLIAARRLRLPSGIRAMVWDTNRPISALMPSVARVGVDRLCLFRSTLMIRRCGAKSPWNRILAVSCKGS